MTDIHAEEVNVPEQNKPDGRLLRSERSRGGFVKELVHFIGTTQRACVGVGKPGRLGRDNFP